MRCFWLITVFLLTKDGPFPSLRKGLKILALAGFLVVVSTIDISHFWLKALRLIKLLFSATRSVSFASSILLSHYLTQL